MIKELREEGGIPLKHKLRNRYPEHSHCSYCKKQTPSTLSDCTYYCDCCAKWFHKDCYYHGHEVEVEDKTTEQQATQQQNQQQVQQKKKPQTKEEKMAKQKEKKRQEEEMEEKQKEEERMEEGNTEEGKKAKEIVSIAWGANYSKIFVHF